MVEGGNDGGRERRRAGTTEVGNDGGRGMAEELKDRGPKPLPLTRLAVAVKLV